MTIRYGSSVLFALACAALLQAAEPEKTPVLLELFTSLGCSSCPPADKLLAEIDRQQPITGARLIVLSEHVDYWNTAKWSDPLSSPLYTRRQEAYDSFIRLEPYTPQLVIDGTAALEGNDWQKAAAAIQRVLNKPCIPVHVAANRAGGSAQIEISVGADPAAKKAQVFLALAHNRTVSHVGGGENAGRDLSEVAVAYSIQQLGKMGDRTEFSKSLPIELPSNSQAGDLRVIAFVRKAGTMEVIGADQLVF